jgi:hypothetical protein
MADRGDIAVVFSRFTMVTRDSRMYPSVGTTGNVVSGTGATANARVSLQDATGMSVDAATADGSGVWTFYDVAQGTWYVRQVSDNARVWKIVVDTALSATVTRLSPGTIVSVG